MRAPVWILLVAVLMTCATARGAVLGQDPYAGYVYPAGGQQGTVFRVMVGGQRLRGVSEAYVSGRGVRVSVVDYQGPGGPLTRLQQEELKRRLQEIRDKRRGGSKPEKPAKQDKKAQQDGNAKRVDLPDLPELRNLDQQSAMQLLRLADRFLNQKKRPKPPIAEEVTLEVTVDADAAPGDREIRLRTPIGLTNPLVFQIGQIPEVREPDEGEGAAPAAKTPVVLNGRIMPGEVDRFALQLSGGERLVVAAQARKLIPYLADAVPGWFQAAVGVYDSDGRELVYDDDCGYDPDPAFVFKAPHDGQYTLEIRDAIYRGREDFVYRVDVCGESMIESLLPSGSRGGVSMLRGPGVRTTGGVGEKEPNDGGKTAMRVTLPRVIDGAISTPGDKDVFAFKGRAGDQVVAEICARKMGSGLDSLLRLIDGSGKVVAVNDDHPDPEAGLLTHHADSYLSAKLPKSGDYFVQVSDAQGHGGADHTYSLRIGPPQPDFALRATPSSLNVAAGRSVVVTVYAVRKDGWDGDIDVVMKDAPEGFVLNGARIPKGRDKVRMTLTARNTPPRPPFARGGNGAHAAGRNTPFARGGKRVAALPSGGKAVYGLSLEGRAVIGGETVVRAVVPADNRMQAFAYQHLVPAEEMLVAVAPGGRRSPSLEMDGSVVRIPAGGTAEVKVSVRPAMPNTSVELALSDPPAGVTLLNQYVQPDQLTLVFMADDKHVGYADNLIVEVFAEVEAKDGKGAQKQRISLGVLPAVPFEIVKHE